MLIFTRVDSSEKNREVGIEYDDGIEEIEVLHQQLTHPFWDPFMDLTLLRQPFGRHAVEDWPLVEEESPGIVSTLDAEIRNHGLHVNREMKALPSSSWVAKPACVGILAEPPDRSYDRSRYSGPRDAV